MEGDFDEDSTPLTGRSIVATIWAALAFGLLGCLGLARLGHAYWVFDLLSHFYLQYAALGVMGALLGLLLRARLAVVLFVVTAGFSIVQLAPLFQAPEQETRTGTSEVRVLALNVLTGNSTPKRAIDWIVSEDPDVVVLQETSTRWIDQLDLPLSAYDRMPTDTVRDDNFGISVYVRRGIQVGEMQVLTEPADLPWIDVVLSKGGRPFHLLAVHALPPTGAENSDLRDQQIKDIAERAAGISGQVVIAGDLNATRWSRSLKKICGSGNLRSAGLGHGVQGTWPSALWFTGMIPIDQVLVSPAVYVSDFRVGPDVGSDHRGVVADLKL